jgi:hypothetical protein
MQRMRCGAVLYDHRRSIIDAMRSLPCRHLQFSSSFFNVLGLLPGIFWGNRGIDDVQSLHPRFIFKHLWVFFVQ